MCDLTADLADASPLVIGQTVLHAQLALWLDQLGGGHLSFAGLLDARARLDSREFGPCEHSRAVQIAVCVSLAESRGLRVEDDPLYREIVPEVPDTPEGIDGPPRW